MRKLTNAMRALLLTLAVAATAAAAPPASAQAPAQPIPPTNQEIFHPLDLAPASDVRTGGGEPGPGYWQNRSDYAIRVTLDTAAHTVTGSETIRYTNNSPESLPFVWVQLDQNLFRPGSRGALVNSSNRWRGAFEGGGERLRRVAVVRDGREVEVQPLVDGTRMRVDLPEPVAARGGTVDLRIDWSFVVPEYGADRMGRFHGEDGWVYEVAQWYPRMYVYDDVDGWNSMPYLGQGEFYLDYGDFDLEITVPRGLIVVATGTLENPHEVLTRDQRSRLDRALRSAETVRIIAPDEVGRAETRPAGRAPLTWRFHAENVRDASWAASKAFIWDAASWEDVLLMAAYPKEGLGHGESDGWENAVQYQRHTISYYSDTWFRYPYPVAINVAGVVGGMEYPMIVFCGVGARDQGLFGVTDHEFGHSWFPMIVGSDERRWAWMDEGFNTFINHYSNLDYYGDEAAPRLRTRPDQIVAQQLAPIGDQPIMTHPDDLRRGGLGFLAYRKPGYGLVLLREVVLGHDRFDAAFRTYIRRWAYRHPKPADFFRTIEEVSGEDLDWFWRGWFMSTELLDQAVDGVAVDDESSHIALSNRAGLVMPVVLELRRGDGVAERVTIPAEAWSTGDDYVLTVAGPPVVGVTVDPDGILPDVDRANNAWGAGSPGRPTGR